LRREHRSKTKLCVGVVKYQSIQPICTQDIIIWSFHLDIFRFG
jgi:hypothetical protein